MLVHLLLQYEFGWRTVPLRPANGLSSTASVLDGTGVPLDRTFAPGDGLALAVAPLLLAGDSILIAVHLYPGAVGEEVLSFSTRLHL